MPAAPPLLYLSQADTSALLTWPEVIDCLAKAYAGDDDPRAAPPKVVARRDGMWLRALTAISAEGGLMGAKIIAKGRPGPADHLTGLWDPETAELACLIEAKTVTAMRTAGTSAVAIDRMARPGMQRVAVLGSGREAATHVGAAAAVRPIGALSVYSPTRENREAFARRFSAEIGIDCRAVGDPRVQRFPLPADTARAPDCRLRQLPALHSPWWPSTPAPARRAA
jgi:ornithine cyclodeaminase/alanine dehydrogenase